MRTSRSSSSTTATCGARTRQADVAKLDAAQDAFFDHYLLGVGAEPAETVTAITQTCPKESASAGPFTAPNWQDLSPGELRFVGAEDQTIAPAAGDPDTNQAFDPVAGGGACATASGDDQQGAATYRLGEAKGGGFTLAGSPTVIADIEAQSPTSQVAARLLDVAPGGQESLVARGLYRPGTGELTEGGARQVFQLHANSWKFENGHVAKLELLPNDAPYGRVSNGQAPVTVSGLDLRLPTRERAGSAVVAPGGVGGASTGTVGGQLPAVLPQDSAPAPGVEAARGCQTGIDMKGYCARRTACAAATAATACAASAATTASRPRRRRLPERQQGQGPRLRRRRRRPDPLPRRDQGPHRLRQGQGHGHRGPPRQAPRLREEALLRHARTCGGLPMPAARTRARSIWPAPTGRRAGRSSARAGPRCGRPRR